MGFEDGVNKINELSRKAINFNEPIEKNTEKEFEENSPVELNKASNAHFYGNEKSQESDSLKDIVIDTIKDAFEFME